MRYVTILPCLLAFALAFSLAGCGKKDITDEDIMKVKQGMSYQQVKGILGEGVEDKAQSENAPKKFTYTVNGAEYVAEFAGDRLLTFDAKPGAAADSKVLAKIQPQMSQADLDKALGVSGVSSNVKVSYYEWKNKDGSKVQATFENDKLLGIGIVSVMETKPKK